MYLFSAQWAIFFKKPCKGRANTRFAQTLAEIYFKKYFRRLLEGRGNSLEPGVLSVWRTSAATNAKPLVAVLECHDVFFLGFN